MAGIAQQHTPLSHAWSWVFAPLIQSLLKRGALWVGLGQLRRHSLGGEVDSKWLYFAAESTEKDALTRLRQRLALVRHDSFTNVVRLTSHYVRDRDDWLVTHDGGTDRETSMAGPFVVNISDPGTLMGFQCENCGLDANREALCSSTLEWENLNEGMADTEGPLSMLDLPPELVDSYVDLFCNTEEDQAQTDEMPEMSKAELKNYALWIRDCSPSASQIVTFPAWTSPLQEASAAGALVICLENGKAFTDPSELTEVFHAFRLGCLGLAWDFRPVEEWHEDREIDDAVKFFAQGTENDKVTWKVRDDHDKLRHDIQLLQWITPHSEETPIGQLRTKLEGFGSATDVQQPSTEEWLRAVSSSTKGLLHVSENDGVLTQPQYVIWGYILVSVLQRLDLTIKGITPEEYYGLPCQPGLVFLCALKQFVAKASPRSPDFSLDLSRSNDVSRKAEYRLKINADGLGKGFLDVIIGRKKNGQPGGTLKTFYNLVRCKVNLNEHSTTIPQAIRRIFDPEPNQAEDYVPLTFCLAPPNTVTLVWEAGRESEAGESTSWPANADGAGSG